MKPVVAPAPGPVTARTPKTKERSKFRVSLTPIPKSPSKKPPLTEPKVENFRVGPSEKPPLPEKEVLELCRSCLNNPRIAGGTLKQRSLVRGHPMGHSGRNKIEDVPLSEIIRQKRKIDPNALKYLAAGLTAKDVEVHAGALNGLCWFLNWVEVPFAISLLSAALRNDPVKKIRLFSAEILYGLLKQKEVPLAISCLSKDVPTEEIRLQSIKTLRRRLRQKEVPFEISLLSAALRNDPSEKVRLRSIEILCELAELPKRSDLQSAVASLAKATFDPSNTVVLKARNALLSMQKQGYGMELAKRVIDLMRESRQR